MKEIKTKLIEQLKGIGLKNSETIVSLATPVIQQLEQFGENYNGVSIALYHLFENFKKEENKNDHNKVKDFTKWTQSVIAAMKGKDIVSVKKAPIKSGVSFPETRDWSKPANTGCDGDCPDGGETRNNAAKTMNAIINNVSNKSAVVQTQEATEVEEGVVSDVQGRKEYAIKPIEHRPLGQDSVIKGTDIPHPGRNFTPTKPEPKKEITMEDLKECKAVVHIYNLFDTNIDKMKEFSKSNGFKLKRGMNWKKVTMAQLAEIMLKEVKAVD